MALAEIAAAQPADGGVRYDVAISETVRTGDPVVLTPRRARISAGRLRTFTSIATLVSDGGGEPVRLHGRFLDITDEICAGQNPATADCIGPAVFGTTAVVRTGGEVT